MPTSINGLKTIYLDHNATSPMEQGAKTALLLFSSMAAEDLPNYGNPSSVHWAGRRVKSVVDDAREQVATAFGIDDPEAICFTGSATEATNMALKGAFFSAFKERRPVRLITSAVEHEATLETAHFLAEMGAELTLLPVSSSGELDLEALRTALSTTIPNTLTIISLMAANNETGVVFPYAEAARLAHEAGALVHLDAVQAPGKLPGFALREAPVDLASFSAHKIGGPKGVGALYVKRGTPLTSLLHGGAQERKRRAGTVNVAGIAAFGAAAEALPRRDLATVKALRDGLEARVRERVGGVRVQGAGAFRVVNTSNFLFEGVRGEGLLMGLDLEGFAVSSGSACNSGSILPSHVLLAMGLDKGAAASAVRVSIGPETTAEELERFEAALARVVERMRAKGRSALLRPGV